MSDEILNRCRVNHAELEAENWDRINPQDWLDSVHCDRGDLLKIVDARTVPEWRPLAVLTEEVLSRHEWWAVRSPVGQVGTWKELRSLPVLCFLAYEPEGIYTAGGKLPGHYTECRPVDSEGVPIPWAEVGQ